jgi:hypothetical protein
MRQGSNGRRPRGRPHRKQQQHGGAPRHNSSDSNGPEGRIRGNAHQVYEKYLALARDALSSGDRISAETHYQRAEHYFRILNASTDPRPNGEGQPGRQSGNGQAEAPGLDDQGRADGQRRPGTASREAAQPEAQPVTEPPRQPSAQARRRPRQAQESEPKPPQVELEPEERPGEENGPAET